MFPPRRFPRPAVALLALTLSAVAPAAVLADVPSSSDSNKPHIIRNSDCFSMATPAAPTPIYTSPRVGDELSRIDIRGKLTVKSGKIGPLTVGGCFSTLVHLYSRTYVLVKAPNSTRYAAALTKWTKAAGKKKQSLAAPKFSSEAAFSSVVKSYAQTLAIPGIQGTVYAPAGSPFALMATTVNGKTLSAAAKAKLIKKYAATGGYATQPNL